MKRKASLLGFLCALMSLVAGAQQPDDSVCVVRPVASVFMAECGRAILLDSYLTPITYAGINVALAYSATQATGFNPEKWVRQLSFGADYSNVDNKLGNNEMHALAAEMRWGIMHRWNPVWKPQLQLLAGPMTQLRGGAIYNDANSNNVVSIKAHWSVGAMAMAVYNTHIGKLPITVAYQASMPLAGVFFSPDYDESFYEMYLGNRSHLAHFGWWGNRFDMDNLITTDLHLRNTILRIGYHNRIERSWVRNLNTHITTHNLVLGVGGDFMSVSGKSMNAHAKIISSIY